MPVTKSAIKALRKDRRRSIQNQPIQKKARTLLKKARLNPTSESLSLAFSAMDKATKKNLMHKKTVSRLKSRLAKAATKSSTPAQPTPKANKKKK